MATVPRHASGVYWRKVLSLWEAPPREPVVLDDETVSAGDRTQHVTQIERANRALQLLKAHNIHVSYSEEVVYIGNKTKTYIRITPGYTVQVRSDLTIEELDSDEKEKKDRYRDRQATVPTAPQRLPLAAALTISILIPTQTYPIIAFLYGALHLPALISTDFPTRIEYYFWLSATATMMFVPLGLLIFMHIPAYSRIKARQTPNIAIRYLKLIGIAVLAFVDVAVCTITAIVAACYPIARAYVLVGSLMGLRSVDERVYEVVQWLAWWPHA